ncbi:MAG: hypothetical protein HXY23_05395 [Parvularculaceae bacterium]|nr:hypothetical protein [Parvularculaceae bacterium]
MAHRIVLAAAALAIGVPGGAAAQVSDRRYDPEMRQILVKTTYGVVVSDLPFDAFAPPPELLKLGARSCAGGDRLSFSLSGGTLSQTLQSNGASETVVVSRLNKGSTIVATGYVVKYRPSLKRPDWVLVRYPAGGILVSSQSTPSGSPAPSPPTYQAFVPCDLKP